MPLGLEADAVGFQVHVRNRASRIGGLGFDVAAVQADVAESGPDPDVVAFLAQVGAAFALVTGAATFFRALEAVAGVGTVE
ncbi:MAG TPA: hypothetical protein VIX37_02845, partial [Candidatus Sulfotelmatobacter sp.]